MVPESIDSPGGATYSYEFRDWSQGNETIRNSITFNGSLFRVPEYQTGAQALEVAGQGQGHIPPTVMSRSTIPLQDIQIDTQIDYAGSWGPLWRATIFEDGLIQLGDIVSIPVIPYFHLLK